MVWTNIMVPAAMSIAKGEEQDWVIAREMKSRKRRTALPSLQDGTFCRGYRGYQSLRSFNHPATFCDAFGMAPEAKLYARPSALGGGVRFYRLSGG